MFDRIVRARLAASKKSVLLLGARQVGKSTLARQLSPDLYVQLADEAAFLSYAKDPARFGREVRALRKPSLIVIDEVQRLPALLNTVQALIDERRGHRFILTGSSARKLKRGGANLLPGRVVLEHLDPLTLGEIGEGFDLDRALRIGMLPGVYDDTDGGDDILDTYATVYLREEIQAEALLRDVGSYARFLDLAATTSGGWINYSKLSSDAEIPKETVRRFYQILEDTLLAFRLPPYTRSTSSRRVIQHDRVLLFDVGVRNALLGVHAHAPSPTDRGFLFEQWLILQCLYFVRAHRLNWNAYGYRTENGAEVDLILDTGRRLLAIECKAGRNVASASFGGLRSFAAYAGKKPVERLVVYQGERAQRFEEGVEAVPWREFLMERLPEHAGRR